jgi:hypothetical protein
MISCLLQEGDQFFGAALAGVFGQGAFPGAVTALWMLSGRGGEAANAVKLGAGVAWLVLAAAVGIAVITGLVRLNYWSATIRDDRMEIRSEMALTKHVAFVLLQVLAGVWLITLA